MLSKVIFFVMAVILFSRAHAAASATTPSPVSDKALLWIRSCSCRRCAVVQIPNGLHLARRAEFPQYLLPAIAACRSEASPERELLDSREQMT